MSRLERLAPLSAFLVTAFIVASFIVTGETPNGDDSAQKVVNFYTDNKDEVIVGSFLATLGAFALVWFAASLRAHIGERNPRARRVAALPFAAAILIAVGITTFSGIEAAAADSVDNIPAEAMQALNALDNDMFFTFALGNLLMYTSLAVAILRYGVFPRWVGWLSAVLAVISVTPVFFVALLASGIYYPLLGWLIYSEQAVEPAPAP
jgi:uncharacterized protein DUF4386